MSICAVFRTDALSQATHVLPIRTDVFCLNQAKLALQAKEMQCAPKNILLSDMSPALIGWWTASKSTALHEDR